LAMRSRIENYQGAMHVSPASGFIFSSNIGCVTSLRAKIWTPRPDPYRRGVDFRRGCFYRSQFVCAIGGDTSQDPAGTSPTLRRKSKDRAHQRHALSGLKLSGITM